MKKYIAEIKLLVTSLIWGSGFIVTKLVLESGVDTITLLNMRFIISSILLGLTCIFLKKKITKHDFIAGAILGILLSLGYISQTFGNLYTTPGKNALFTGLNVVIVPYISLFLFKNKVNKSNIVASILAFIGVYILSGNMGNFNFDGINIGDILSILCAIIFALHLVYIGHYASKIGVIQLAFTQFLVASLILSSLNIYFGISTNLNTYNIGLILYLGIFCNYVGHLLQISAQRDISSSKASIILSLEVLFGTFISILLSYDKFELSMILGTIIIFSSIIISETNLLERVNYGKE